MGIITILWEKWVEFRRDFYKITLAAMIAPLMYLVVFGMGIQTITHPLHGKINPDKFFCWSFFCCLVFTAK